MRKLLASFLVLFVLSIHTSRVYCQSALFQGIDKIGGNVYTTALDTPNKILYVGGNFVSINNEGRYGASIYKSTGAVKPGYPSPNFMVNTSVPDGNGGWYIGGQFTTLNGTHRPYLAQLNANGEINTELDMVNAQVKSLLISNDTLFVGGEFTNVGSDLHKVNGAISDINGTILHEINLGSDLEYFNGSAADGNGGWFVYGRFSTINNQGRINVAQLNASGVLTSWNTNVDGEITQAKTINNYLLISGSFTSVNGQPRLGFAMLDKNTGALLPVVADMDAGRIASSFLVTGDSLIMGGTFDKINGQLRNGLAFLKISTNELLPSVITPNFSQVASMQLYNNKLYFSGPFTQVNATNRNGFAVYDLTTNLLSPLNPFNSNPSIGTLTVEGNTLYAFGFFTAIGITPRNRIAAFDLITESLTSFNSAVTFSTAPGGNGTGLSRGFIDGNTIYTGGSFTYVNDIPRQGYAALDIVSGELKDFNPVSGTIGQVSMSSSNGAFLFASNSYFDIGGSSGSKYLAAINTTTGKRLNWNIGVNSYVNTIQKKEGQVYIAGGFSSINTVSRSKLASFDVSTSTVSNWNPAPNGFVNTIAIDGGNIYTGGTFTSIGGQLRNRIAGLDDVNGLASSWNPNANNTVNSILIDNTTIYTGGIFTNIGGQTRNRLASLSAVTGLATSWNPNSSGTINTLALKDGILYAAGLAGLASQPPSIVNAFDITTSTPTLLPFAVNGGFGVQTISFNGNLMYLGGNFPFIGGIGRSHLAAIDLTTGKVTSWNPLASGEVRSLVINNSKLYACGLFSSIGGQFRSRLAAFDLGTGNLSSWAISTFNSGSFQTMAFSGNTIYVGGAVSGTTLASNPFFPRSNLFSFDLTTGAVLPWAPLLSSNYTVYSILIENNILYAGGTFPTVNSIARNRLASFDLASGNLTTWNPDVNGQVWTITKAGNNIIAGGEFTTVGGIQRNHLAEISSTTGLLTSTDLGTNSSVRHVRTYGNTLYVQGNYTSIGGQPRRGTSSYYLSSGKLSTWNPNDVYAPNETSPWGLHTNIFNDTAIIGGIYFPTTGHNGRIGLAMTYIDKTIRSSTNILSYRPGENIVVSFDAAGVNNLANSYTLELSDATGSFANPTQLGTLNSANTAGTINAPLMANLPPGEKYRVRINSTDPVRTGNDNGEDITIISIHHRFVNDNNTTGDLYTHAVGNNINSGTPLAPYATLDYAITQSQPGDTIFVDAGTYNTPNKVINKAVTILGTNFEISPNDATNKLVSNTARNAESIINNATLTIGSNDISIKGLTFSAGDKTLINLLAASFGNFTFEKNKLIIGTGNLVQLDGAPASTPATLTASGFTFSDNRFEKLASGSGVTFYINYLKNVLLNNNAFLVTGPTPRNQVTAWIGPGGLVADFTLSDNVVDKANYNIFTISISNATITGNKFYNALNGLFIQSSFTGSTDILVENNLIENNLPGSAISNVLVCRIFQSGVAGISRARILNNTININATGLSFIPPAITTQFSSTVVNPSMLISGNRISHTGNYNSFTSSSVSGISLNGKNANTIVENNELSFTGTNLIAFNPVNNSSFISSGILLSTDPVGNPIPANATISFLRNKIHGYPQAVSLYDGNSFAPDPYVGYGHLTTGATLNINDNSFTGDLLSINNGTVSQTVNATCNWYGVTAAHDVITKITPATVSYIPWLSNGTDSDLPMTGFQPLPLACSGSPITATASKTNITCNGANDGKINIIITGGLSPYSFTWSKNNISGFSTAQNLINLSPATYRVAIVDANGSTASVENIIITQPSILTALATGTSTSCTNTASVVASGGTIPYSYLWSNGAITSTITDLAAGTYSVTVTDANGCIASSSATVTAKEAFNPAIQVTHVSCFGSSNGTLTVTNGNSIPPYQYSIDGGIHFQNSNLFTGLPAGTYTATVRDVNGCTGFATKTINQPPVLAVVLNRTEPTCSGLNKGKIFITASGGSGPRSFSWTGPNGYTSNSQDIANLAPGIYNLIVTDNNSCTANLSAIVTEWPAIIVNEIITNIACKGIDNGMINLTVTGGSGGGFSFDWSGPHGFNASSKDIANLEKGNYKLTVTDNLSGCELKKTYSITEPAAELKITSSKTNATGCFSFGTITASGSGGIPPYQYRINNGSYQPTGLFGGLYAGNYTVWVKDVNGCTKTATENVTDNGSDEFENNNSKNQAKLINVETTIAARIATAADLADWFKFTTPAAGGNYVLTFQHPSPGFIFNIYPADNNTPALLSFNNTVNSKEYLLTGNTIYYVGITGGLSYVCYSLTVASTSTLRPGSSIIVKQDRTVPVDNLTLFVYPNPHRGNFSLKVETGEPGLGVIELFNQLGQKIVERKVILPNGISIIQFKDIKESVLIYKLRVGNQIKTGKIIGPQ